VEVVAQEEIEEKLLMRPGNISMMLAETEATALLRVEPLSELRAETADTAFLDFGYTYGPLEASLTLFGSDINHAGRTEDVAADRVRLVDAVGTTRTPGAEVLMRWRQEPFSVTGSYLFVDASEPDELGEGRRDVPPTPRHSAGLVAVWEAHDRGRIWLEVYYTGEQPLDDNPYRNQGESYFEVGLLGEIVLGRYRLFLNLENLLEARQTRRDLLVRRERAPGESWTVDAWQPLEGFVANAGVRVRFGE
jgi:outer membrane receptor for ferrienterochelin and colicins